MNYRVFKKIRNAVLVLVLIYVTYLTITAKSPYYYLAGKSEGGVMIAHETVSKMDPVELKKFHWLIVLGMGRFPLALLVMGLVADALTFFVCEQEKHRVLIASTVCYALALWMFYPAIPVLLHILAT